MKIKYCCLTSGSCHPVEPPLDPHLKSYGYTCSNTTPVAHLYLLALKYVFASIENQTDIFITIYKYFTLS